MINHDMLEKLSKLLHDFFEQKKLDNTDKIYALKSSLKITFESIIEQIHSHILKKTYRSLDDTRFQINLLLQGSHSLNQKDEKILTELKNLLTKKNAFIDTIYTENSENLVDYILNDICPFYKCIFEFQISAEAKALVQYLKYQGI